MDIKDIARKSVEIVRDYMREQSRELIARDFDIDYGHTVFDGVKSIDVCVYPYGEDSLRAFIVLSDSYGDVLDIHSDIIVVDNTCPTAVVGVGRWACGFVEDWFADMWDNADGIIVERERIKRLAEIRDDVEFRAVMGD